MPHRTRRDGEHARIAIKSASGMHVPARESCWRCALHSSNSCNCASCGLPSRYKLTILGMWATTDVKLPQLESTTVARDSENKDSSFKNEQSLASRIRKDGHSDRISCKGPSLRHKPGNQVTRGRIAAHPVSDLPQV